MNRNDEVDEMMHQSSMGLGEFENELFEIKTRHATTVAPLRDFIEQWLKKELIKITKPKSRNSYNSYATLATT